MFLYHNLSIFLEFCSKTPKHSKLLEIFLCTVIVLQTIIYPLGLVIYYFFDYEASIYWTSLLPKSLTMEIKLTLVLLCGLIHVLMFCSGWASMVLHIVNASVYITTFINFYVETW